MYQFTYNNLFHRELLFTNRHDCIVFMDNILKFSF
jgi:hypothetical protein